MSFIYAFTCDICGTADVATPREGLWSYQAPSGWRTIDGRHCCSLACVGSYAADPDAYPRQQLDPDPFIEAFKNLKGRPRVSAS